MIEATQQINPSLLRTLASNIGATLLSIGVCVIVLAGGGVYSPGLLLGSVLIGISALLPNSSHTVYVDKTVLVSLIFLFALVFGSYLFHSADGISNGAVTAATSTLISAIVFLKVLQFSGTSRHILLISIAFLLIFECAYALYALATSEVTILGTINRSRNEFATGSFGNRNLFAAYCAVTTPIVFGYIWNYVREKSLRLTLLILLTSFCTIAVFASGSRLGCFAYIVGIGLATIRCANIDNEKNKARRSTILAIGALGAISASWFGVTPVLKRYLNTSEDESRLEIWHAVSEISLNDWIYGVGPGEFSNFYQSISPASVIDHIHYLHQDALQFVIEHGSIVGIATTIISSVLVLNLKNSKNNTMLGVTSFSAIVAGAISSFADFPIHIAATSISFFIATGLLFSNIYITETRSVL